MSSKYGTSAANLSGGIKDKWEPYQISLEKRNRLTKE